MSIQRDVGTQVDIHYYSKGDVRMVVSYRGMVLFNIFAVDIPSLKAEFVQHKDKYLLLVGHDTLEMVFRSLRRIS